MTGHWPSIAKGLTEGQAVVTDGQSRLQAGTKVAANDALAAGRRTGEARRLRAGDRRRA